MAKKRKDWGFIKNGVWVQNQIYLQQTDPRHNQWGHSGEPTRYGTWESKGREIDF